MVINHKREEQATTEGNSTHPFRVVKIQGTIRMGRGLPGSTVFPARGLVWVARVREAERSALDSEIFKKSFFILRGLPLNVKSASTWYNNLLTW
jgi:hypothetical protein